MDRKNRFGKIAGGTLKLKASPVIFFTVIALLSNLCYAEKTITFADFKDKLMGGWLGQGAGVSWAAETEGSSDHGIISAGEVPDWSPDMVNQMFDQDDNYCEIPFVHCCVDNGVNATPQQFGAYWKETSFMLWCANDAARNNLNNGIQAPWSGHYTKHRSVEDIDWQIESNWSGMMCPGLPVAAADISFRAGHVTNYGDGVYGGVFTAAMQSAAYFASNVTEIVNAGRDVIPVGSAYRQMIDDMIAWRAANSDWTVTWQACEAKYGRFHRMAGDEGSCWVEGIQCQCNGAYILMGLLYGNGDYEESVRISMRCGKDSDCNPSSTAAIMASWIGFAAMDSKWKSGLSLTGQTYQSTSDDFTEVINMNCNLAREVVKMSGGTVENEGAGNEVWTIPDQATIPLILEAVPGNVPDNPASSPENYSQSAALMPTVSSMTITENSDGTYNFTAEATAASGKTIDQYQWFFGDLSYKTGQTVTHGYRADGTYPVTVYVNDNIGITAWKAQELIAGGTTNAKERTIRPAGHRAGAFGTTSQCYTIRGQRIASARGASPRSLTNGVYIDNSGSGARTKGLVLGNR